MAGLTGLFTAAAISIDIGHFESIRTKRKSKDALSNGANDTRVKLVDSDEPSLSLYLFLPCLSGDTLNVCSLFDQ